MTPDVDVILENELVQVIVEAETTVQITGEESFDIIMDGETVVTLDSDTIDVVMLSEPGPKGATGEPGTKLTVGLSPPPSPRVGDLWWVRDPS